MGKLDQVYDSFSNKKKEYNKGEYIEFKKNEKEKVYQLIDATAEKVVQNANEFKKYLDTQSKFEQYSVGNNLLITAQMPQATNLRDYNSWVNSGSFPKRNYKQVKILEPADTYMREDGSVGTNWNVKYLIDESEVSTKQKQRPMKYSDKILLRVFLNCSLAKIQVVEQIPEVERSAFYDKEQELLFIAKGAETPQIFYEVAQELAIQEIGEDTVLDSFKVNCVSYMLCKKYGIDVSGINIADIPYELKEMSARKIREELEPIQNAMENISGRASQCINLIMRQNREKVEIR